MTATTTDSDTLAALDAWLAQATDERDATIRTNHLRRLAGAVALAELLDEHDATTGDTGAIVALDRGPGREHLPHVVALAMTAARKSGNVGTGAPVDISDTVVAVVIRNGDDVALAELPAPIGGGSASASQRTPTRTPLGHVGSMDALVTVKLPDSDGRVPWRFDLRPHSTGPRGAKKKSAI